MKRRPKVCDGPGALRLCCPPAVSCRGSRRAGRIALRVPVPPLVVAWPLGTHEFSKGRVNLRRIHSVPGIIIATYITFFAEATTGTCCLYLGHSLLSLPGRPSVSGLWNQDMELTLKETNNRLPGQLASQANALPSQLLLPPIYLLRTSVRPHSFLIHHLSSFARSLILFPYSSLSPFPHLARTGRTPEIFFQDRSP